MLSYSLFNFIEMHYVQPVHISGERVREKVTTEIKCENAYLYKMQQKLSRYKCLIIKAYDIICLYWMANIKNIL